MLHGVNTTTKQRRKRKAVVIPSCSTYTLKVCKFSEWQRNPEPLSLRAELAWLRAAGAQGLRCADSKAVQLPLSMEHKTCYKAASAKIMTTGWFSLQLPWRDSDCVSGKVRLHNGCQISLLAVQLVSLSSAEYISNPFSEMDRKDGLQWADLGLDQPVENKAFIGIKFIKLCKTMVKH